MSYMDVEISAHSTREVSTHGRLLVTRKGFLNSTRVQCASAQIDGRISGRIECIGLLRLGGLDQCKAQIHAVSLLVDRGANIQLAYTAVIGDGVIRGRVVGDVVCTGSLRIAKHGILLGEVETRALTVDRGGIYSGDVRVGSQTNTEERADADGPRLSSGGMWLQGFTFGAT
jgi:cytoskeletal protein CcmA (bactofilin family)